MPRLQRMSIESSQVGDSDKSIVCHQPHATFLGIQPSMLTCEGILRSITSPNPSCLVYLVHGQSNGNQHVRLEDKENYCKWHSSIKQFKRKAAKLPDHICSIPSKTPCHPLQDRSKDSHNPCYGQKRII